MTRRMTIGLLIIAACGPDLAVPAELDEVCGQAAPARILDLPPDAALTSVGALAVIDGRQLVSIGFREDGDEPDAVGGLTTARRELWSVGPCGESPTLLPNQGGVVRYDRWADLLLTCDRDRGEVSTLDPNGLRPPNVVFRAAEVCRGTPTEDGIVVVDPTDESWGDVLLLPWVEDPWTETATPEALLEGVRMQVRTEPHAGPAFTEVSQVLEDAVFAIDSDDRLIVLSLVDRTITVEADNVREFDVSRDGRYVVWQDLEPTDDDPDWPAGAVYLLDRAQGAVRYLADAPLAGTHVSALDFADEGVVWLQLGYLYREPARYWSLPEMRSVDLPLGQQARLPLEDGRWLVDNIFAGPYFLYGPDLREGRSLFAYQGDTVHADDIGKGMTVIRGFECCIGSEFGKSEGSLWFVPWDGAATRLANRVTNTYATLSDDRIVTALDVDDDSLGTLTAIDPADLVERVVDHGVLSTSAWVDDDDNIYYAVVDGDDTGVWVSRLAQ